MKKLLIIIMIIFIALGLTACSGSEPTDSSFHIVDAELVGAWGSSGGPGEGHTSTWIFNEDGTFYADGYVGILTEMGYSKWSADDDVLNLYNNNGERTRFANYKIDDGMVVLTILDEIDYDSWRDMIFVLVSISER